MINSNHTKIILDIQLESKTFIEHLFNNHKFFDLVWCRPKRDLEKLNKIKQEEVR